jgi:hypothetical protein
LHGKAKGSGTVDRHQAQIHKGSSVSSRAGVLGFLAVVLVIATALVWARQATKDRVGRAPLSLAPALPSGEYLPNGELVTLGEAVASAGFPLYRPSDPLASDESLTAAWLQKKSGDDSLGNQVALIYASGLWLYLGPSPADKDVVSYLEALRTQLLLPVEDIVNINGKPALLIPQVSPGAPPEPTGNATHPENAAYPGSVIVVFDGVQVSVIGQFDSTTLLRVAETLTDKG